MTDFYKRSLSLVIGTAGASKSNVAIHGMQSQLSPYQTRANIPMFALHGIISRPLPGAQMVVLYGDNDPSKAVCVGVNDPRYNLEGLPDGCVGIAQHLGASVLFYDDRIQLEGNGKPIVLNNTGNITINTTGGTGNVTIIGNILATGEITAHSTGAAVLLSQHTHTDPQGGTVGLPSG